MPFWLLGERGSHTIRRQRLRAWITQSARAILCCRCLAVGSRMERNLTAYMTAHGRPATRNLACLKVWSVRCTQPWSTGFRLLEFELQYCWSVWDVCREIFQLCYNYDTLWTLIQPSWFRLCLPTHNKFCQGRRMIHDWKLNQMLLSLTQKFLHFGRLYFSITRSQIIVVFYLVLRMYCHSTNSHPMKKLPFHFDCQIFWLAWCGKDIRTKSTQKPSGNWIIVISPLIILETINSIFDKKCEVFSDKLLNQKTFSIARYTQKLEFIEFVKND